MFKDRTQTTCNLFGRLDWQDVLGCRIRDTGDGSRLPCPFLSVIISRHLIAGVSNNLTLTLQTGPQTDSAGTLKKALERTFSMSSTNVPCLCGTSLFVKSSVIHAMSTKPAFQGVASRGSVPGGSANATARLTLGKSQIIDPGSLFKREVPTL